MHRLESLNLGLGRRGCKGYEPLMSCEFQSTTRLYVLTNDWKSVLKKAHKYFSSQRAACIPHKNQKSVVLAHCSHLKSFTHSVQLPVVNTASAAPWHTCTHAHVRPHTRAHTTVCQKIIYVILSAAVDADDFVMRRLPLTDGWGVQTALVASTLQCLPPQVVTSTFVQLARGLAGKTTANKQGVCSCDSFREASSPPVSRASSLTDASLLKSWQQRFSIYLSKHNVNIHFYPTAGRISFLLTSSLESLINFFLCLLLPPYLNP